MALPLPARQKVTMDRQDDDPQAAAFEVACACAHRCFEHVDQRRVEAAVKRPRPPKRFRRRSKRQVIAATMMVQAWAVLRRGGRRSHGWTVAAWARRLWWRSLPVGREAVRCLRCGHEFTDCLPGRSHAWSEGIASFGDEAVRSASCLYCDAVWSREGTPASPHNIPQMPHIVIIRETRKIS